MLAGALLGALLFTGEAEAAPATTRTVPVTAGFGALKQTGLQVASLLQGFQTTMTITDGNAATADDYTLLKVGMTLRIDQEQMKVTGIFDNAPNQPTVTLLRGQSGTSAVDHQPGRPIYGNYIKIPLVLTDVTFRNGGTLAAAVGSQTTQNSGARLLDSITTSCVTIPFVGCSSVLNITDQSLLIANSIVTIDAEQMSVFDIEDSAGDGWAGAEELLLGSNPASLVSTPESLYFGGICADGIDNDLDGVIDVADSGCSATDNDKVIGVDEFPNSLETALGSNPNSSSSTPENRVIFGTCTDGIDNDGDTLMDGADSGCDPIDGDLDGFTGAYERAFSSDPGDIDRRPETSLAGGSCSDGIDNDGDGAADAIDAGCSLTDTDGDTFPNAVETALGSSPTNASRMPEHAAIIDSCDDGIDNDGDGLIDADDSACNSLDVDPDTITVLRGQNGSTIAAHAAQQAIFENVFDLPVSDKDLVGDASTIRVDNEEMLVLRGREGSPDVLEVRRAQNATSAASHSSGATISDIDGLGSFDFTINIDSAKAGLVRAELDPTGGFLQNTGRVPTCLPNSGPFENSGAVLNTAIGTAETVLNVSDQSVFRVGGTIRIDSEQMTVRGVTEAPQDTITVIRSVSPAPASHGGGAAIFGQNLAVGGYRMVCITTGATPLGPTGSGAAYPAGLGQALARVVLMPTQTTYVGTPLIPTTLSNVALLDVSGDSIPSNVISSTLAVYKCPDVIPFGQSTTDGVATNGDLLNLARAIFLGAPQFPPSAANHDMNGDGAMNSADMLAANRVVALGESLVFCKPL